MTIATKSGKDSHLVAVSESPTPIKSPSSKDFVFPLKDSQEAPKFIKCLRDIVLDSIDPLLNPIILEVEAAGHPTPNLFWLHNNQPLNPFENLKIETPDSTKSRLTISRIFMPEQLGIYSVVATNAVGIVQTNATIKFNKSREQFHESVLEASVEIADENVDEFVNEDKQQLEAEDLMEHRRDSRLSMRSRKHKGAPPTFVIGLEDMELKAGNTAAVAGKASNKSKQKL